VTESGSGLLDTSVFIARETERPLGELPNHVAVSVVTIGELQLGVLNASGPDSRARRAAPTRSRSRGRRTRFRSASR